MYYVEQNGSFEAIFESGVSGAVGALQLQIEDNLGAIVNGPSPLGIIEHPAGSGFYQAVRTAPGVIGQYSLVWSLDGSFDVQHTSVDDLTVVAAGAGDALPPISPVGPGPGPIFGPCNAWTTEEAVAACCNVSVGSDLELFSDAVDSSSRILWEESGRLYSGTCDKTVRPCQTRSSCWGQVLSRGHIIDGGDIYGSSQWDGYGWGDFCGCRPLSQVLLSGYPVREIIQVKIDGVVVDPATYRLDDWRKLVRTDDRFWPSCQDLSRNDTETGTWSVRYTYGQNPPNIGQQAAQQLACEIYKSCLGDAECQLPTGVTRITRQGLTLERAFFQRDKVVGAWRTGLTSVDLFLNTYNPSGLRRRPSVWSPDIRYARKVGSV